MSDIETPEKGEPMFVLTREGRLGIGVCQDMEGGGTKIVKWCPDGFIKEAFAAILKQENKP